MIGLHVGGVFSLSRHRPKSSNGSALRNKSSAEARLHAHPRSMSSLHSISFLIRLNGGSSSAHSMNLFLPSPSPISGLARNCTQYRTFTVVPKHERYLTVRQDVTMSCDTSLITIQGQ